MACTNPHQFHYLTQDGPASGIRNNEHIIVLQNKINKAQTEFFFSNRIVLRWNKLPKSAIEAKSSSKRINGQLSTNQLFPKFFPLILSEISILKNFFRNHNSDVNWKILKIHWRNDILELWTLYRFYRFELIRNFGNVNLRMIISIIINL